MSAVLDPATDMRLAHNRLRAEPMFRVVLRPDRRSDYAPNWLFAETDGAGRIWLRLDAHTGCSCSTAAEVAP